MDLKDEKVVLTGATGGIGSALSQVLANAGAKLILIARTSEKLELLLTKLQGQGHKYYAFDFTRVDETEDLCKKIIEENDHIDILINAAGVGIYKNIEDVEYREWQDKCYCAFLFNKIPFTSSQKKREIGDYQYRLRNGKNSDSMQECLLRDKICS